MKPALPEGPVLHGLALEKAKTCNCCKTMHYYVPLGSPESLGLYWWNCMCGSTLVKEVSDD